MIYTKFKSSDILAILKDCQNIEKEERYLANSKQGTLIENLYSIALRYKFSLKEENKTK